MIGGNMEDEEAPGSPMRSYDALPIEISFSRAPQGSPSPRNNGRSYRPLLLSILALFVTLLLVDSMTTKHLEHLTIEFMNWVSAHPLLGVVAVTVVYALATILFVPGSVLTIGTGFAFRRASDSYGKALFLASLSVFMGATLGSICAFLLGRYLLREWVAGLASQYPIIRAVDRALETNGLKIMVLLRLSPLIPYNALDYISGITAIPVLSYSLALVGTIPGIILFCSIGATASSLSEGNAAAAENRRLRTFAAVFGTTFALAGVVLASYYSKIELDKILQADNPRPSSPTASPSSEVEAFNDEHYTDMPDETS